MHILVFNSGSSSIKFSLFETHAGLPAESKAVLEGEASELGTDAAGLRVQGAADTGASLKAGDGAEQASAAITRVVSADGVPRVDALGYRIVHPGPKIKNHTALTPEVMRELEAAVEFAPLHMPESLKLMKRMGARLPGIPAFCCFDTVFHETMPEEASTYALPEAVRARGVRRYGFHGLSCESVVDRLRREGGPVPRRLIVAHLGSGCSVTAILDGKSVDTSMGLTPDGGIVMGTRPGDLDAGVVLFLLRGETGSREDAVRAVEGMLNRDAGVHALSGLPNDMRRVREAAVHGDVRAELAVRVFTRSVRKAIGSYVAILGGVDLLVFTGGIGEHDAASRTEICAGMEALGIALDAEATAGPVTGSGIDRTISGAGARAVIRVMAAEEERVIAGHVTAMMTERGAV